MAFVCARVTRTNVFSATMCRFIMHRLNSAVFHKTSRANNMLKVRSSWTVLPGHRPRFRTTLPQETEQSLFTAATVALQVV